MSFVDDHPVVDGKGNRYIRTIRRVNCTILCESGTLHPKRCRSCQAFRSTLWSSVSRLNDTDNTAATSHASYASLSPGEKDKRLKNLHQTL